MELRQPYVKHLLASYIALNFYFFASHASR